MFAALLLAKQCPMLSAPGCLASWQLIRVGRQLPHSASTCAAVAFMLRYLVSILCGPF